MYLMILNLVKDSNLPAVPENEFTLNQPGKK